MKPSREEIENYRTHEYVRRTVDDNWYFVEHTTWGAVVKLKAQLRRFCAVLFNCSLPTCPYCGSDLIAETHCVFSPYGTYFCFACKALFWKENEPREIDGHTDKAFSLPVVDFRALGDEADE